MQVKAKFQVQLITKHQGGAQTVSMAPVIGGSDENKSWSQYTPSGKLEMYITNPDAYNQFEPGDEFYVTLEKAEVAPK